MPEITVIWDAERQMPSLKFEASEFKTWDFVIMVLEGARRVAEEQRRITIMQGMQQQMAERAQNEMIARQLKIKH
jgi:hypothetical protein